MDLAKIYPYVVPASYLEGQAESLDGLILPLGHDVFAVPVHDLGSVCHNVLPDDLAEAGLSPAELHEEALMNLEALAQSKAIQKSMHQVPGGFQVIVWSGHWLGASCMRLPRLFEFASQRLETDRLCISIPQRELLFVFPFGTHEQREQMREIILDNEANAQKQITWELFSLSADGLQPLVDEPKY